MEESQMKQKPVEINDICLYRFPENLQYSPDGKLLAFQCAYADEKGNGYRRDVWLAENGECRQVTWTLDASLVLWDDDTHLILKRNTGEAAHGTTELFLLDVHGGEAKPWITLPFMMRSLHKVRDGLYAALGMIHANDPDAYLRGGEIRTLEHDADYTVVDEIPYWHNGSDYTNKIRTALFRVNTENGLKVKRLSGPYTNVQSVETDGDTVYFTDETHERKESRLCQIHAWHADTDRITSVYAKKDYSIRGLIVMEHQLYCLVSDMKEYGLGQSPHIARVNNKKIELITKPDRSFGSHATTDVLLGGGKSMKVCGDHLITLVTDQERVCIWEFDSDMHAQNLYHEPGIIPFMDASGEKIAFCRVTADHPAELYEMDRKTGTVSLISHLNDAAVESRYVALPERLDYVSCNEELRGWVLKPKDYNPKKKYPAVLDVHGGPRGIYSEAFFHEMQVWASRGYFVFFTNIIGSDGRGDAFADVRGKYGTVDYQNLMDFTDEVLKKYPQIDGKKVCATGGSYGGWMMNWIEGHTDRFCALASQRSIANWVSLSFIADIGPWFDPSECGVGMEDNLLAEESFAKLWQYSPLKYAQGAKTPMLFIHSDEDRRCPVWEGMQMMQALTVQDVETRMVIFRGENHELSRGGKPVHRIRRLSEISDWFDKHAK